MHDPARKALYCLLLVLISAGLIRFGIERYETAGEGWGSTGPMVLGLALLPFPLVYLVQALFAMRGSAKLLAGIGVIARWQVDPMEWSGSEGSTGSARPLLGGSILAAVAAILALATFLPARRT